MGTLVNFHSSVLGKSGESVGRKSDGSENEEDDDAVREGNDIDGLDSLVHVEKEKRCNWEGSVGCWRGVIKKCKNGRIVEEFCPGGQVCYQLPRGVVCRDVKE